MNTAAMRKGPVILGALAAALALGAMVYLFTLSDTTPRRTPIDGSTLPDRALEAACVLGGPVMVSVTSADLGGRLVFFPDPIKESGHEHAEVFAFVGYYVSTPPNPFGDALELFQTLDAYKPASVPDELADYQLLKIEALPERLDEVVDLLGPWQTLIHRSNPKRERRVWRRDMCIGDTLIRGLWVETIEGKVIKSRGISNLEKLERML